MLAPLLTSEPMLVTRTGKNPPVVGNLKRSVRVHPRTSRGFTSVADGTLD
jgi:hypothetical protein